MRRKIVKDFDLATVNRQSIDSLYVVYDATHYGYSNLNSCVYDPEFIESNAASFVKPYGKPILTDHVTESEISREVSKPLGRVRAYSVLSADGIKESNTPTKKIRLLAKITDQRAIKGLLDKSYLTCSTSGFAEGPVFCSYCKKDLTGQVDDSATLTEKEKEKREKCEEEHYHSRGKVIDGEKISHIYTKMSYRELSLVNIPADQSSEHFSGLVAMYTNPNSPEFQRDLSENTWITYSPEKKALVRLTPQSFEGEVFTDVVQDSADIEEVTDKNQITVKNIDLSDIPVEELGTHLEYLSLWGDPDEVEEAPKDPESEDKKKPKKEEKEDEEVDEDIEEIDEESEDLDLEEEGEDGEDESEEDEETEEDEEDSEDKKLSTKQRNKLKGSTFCGPNRSFPVNDCNHYKAALSLLGRYKGPGDKEKIRACIIRKGVKLGCTSKGKDSEDSWSEPKIGVTIEANDKILEDFSKTFDLRIADAIAKAVVIATEAKLTVSEYESKVSDLESKNKELLLEKDKLSAQVEKLTSYVEEHQKKEKKELIDSIIELKIKLKSNDVQAAWAVPDSEEAVSQVEDYRKVLDQKQIAILVLMRDELTSLSSALKPIEATTIESEAVNMEEDTTSIKDSKKIFLFPMNGKIF